MTQLAERTGFNAAAGVLASALLIYGVTAVVRDTALSHRGAQHASASMSITAGVMPNEFNTLAQQLRDKEAALAEREARVESLERSGSGIIPRFAGAASGEYSLALSALLFLLIVLNFFLDRRRAHQGALGARGEQSAGAVVDLHA